MNDGASTRRGRPIRVRADEGLAPRVQRSDRGSTLWVNTREPVRLHQAVRLELGLGPLADEILIDAVVREVRLSKSPGGAPEVLFGVDPRHEDRFAYVYAVINGRREIVTRRYRRVAARFPIMWTQGGRSHRSFTGDIAVGGTFVLAEEAPPPGTSVELELWLDSEQAIEVSGLVTWVGVSRGEDGFGIRFRKVDALVFNRLRELVRLREDV